MGTGKCKSIKLLVFFVLLSYKKAEIGKVNKKAIRAGMLLRFLACYFFSLYTTGFSVFK